jgi:hypothetical protein
MPYVPLLAGWSDWFYLGVGIASTGVLWWKRNLWTKAMVSVIAFVAVAYAFQFAGMHKCFEGRPPALLEYFVGAIAAALPWALGQWRLAVPVAFAIVFLTGTFTARALADSYHGPGVTGNPAFSSGRFWHTPVSGQFPRDPKKVEEFWNRLGRGP